MGYTVDLQSARLCCRSERDAHRAIEVIEANEAMWPYHFQAFAKSMSNPPRDDSWALSVEAFQGDHWNNDDAEELWLALTPHLADGSTLELQGEEGERWRIRWQGGHVFEDYVAEVIWALDRELTRKERP